MEVKILDKIPQVINGINSLSVKGAVLFISILAASLLSYWSYVQIDMLRQSNESLRSEVKNNSPSGVFQREFGIVGMEFDKNLHDDLVNLRAETNADWAIVWGFHNGQTMGPFHLKRMSAVDESSAPGAPLLYEKLQNLHITLFSSYLYQFWEKNEITYGETKNIENKNFRGLYSTHGIDSYVVTPIFIDNFETPIGLIALYYKRSNGSESDSLENISSITSILGQYKDAIEFKFNLKYEQLHN